ncbi:MAG: hypothetical protein C4325_06420 [Blastocatellia bacterium]
MSLNQISYSLPPTLDDAIRATTERWKQDDLISRIWNRDSSVWTGSDEANWLGWLTIAEE